MNKELLQQALDALKGADQIDVDMQDAIIAIESAIAQSEQQPEIDLDFARAMCRSAGISLVSRDFIERFADFVNDWRKGDFELPKLAALDVQSCFDAWQKFDPELATTPQPTPAQPDHPTAAMQIAGGAVLLDYRGDNEAESEKRVGWLTAARVFIAMQKASTTKSA